MEILDQFQTENHIDLLKAADLRALSARENRGYPFGIILACALPREPLRKLRRDGKASLDFFSQSEAMADGLADRLALLLQERGFRAISQSEQGIGLRGEFDPDTRSSLLPHKKPAVLAGLGWIGRNNLLVTESFGPALVLSSVLTDAPLDPEKASRLPENQCGICTACVRLCPAQVLHGEKWTPGMARDRIVDVYHCVTCLKCLAGCRYTAGYLC